MSWKSSADMYTPPRVKQAASGSCLIAQGRSSSPGDGPGERGCRGLGGGSGAKGHLRIHGYSVCHPARQHSTVKQLCFNKNNVKSMLFLLLSFFLSFVEEKGNLKITEKYKIKIFTFLSPRINHCDI